MTILHLYLQFLPQSTAEIQKLPVMKTNGRRYNYTSGFDFGFVIVSGIVMLLQPSTFHTKRTTPRTTYSLLKMAATASQIYFRFRAGDVINPRTSKPLCRPNCHKLSQSTAEIFLPPVSKDKRPPKKFYFRFWCWLYYRQRRVILRHRVPNLFKSRQPRWSHDVISVFKMAATASQFFFQFRIL